MSDNEEGGKKSGYRLEYASSARAKCKGPKPCAGTTINKGELRMGSLVDFRGNTTFAWRHWGCVTPKVITNMKKSFEEPDELDGFEDLKEEDQDKIRKAWEVGHVADEDIPESARKSSEDEEEEDEEDEEKPKKKKAPAKAAAKKEKADEPGVFKLEYSSSARAKCKGCGTGIGRDFFRIGHEVDFRGNKSFQFMHWGCLPQNMFEKLKSSYGGPSDVEGFKDLKEAEQDKVKRAWEADEIPEDDKGPGEAVADVGKKKAPAKRAKKGEDGEPPKKRAKKAADGEPPKKRARKAPKKAKDESEDEEEEEEEEEEEKPKKRAPARKAAEKQKKAPVKKRASKKEDNESGEDFGNDIAAVGKNHEDEDEDDVEEEEEHEEASKKRKRAAPASKVKASKPTSKTATKPSSSRKRQLVPEYTDEDEDEDD